MTNVTKQSLANPRSQTEFGSDWYIAEYDGENLFFGFAILNSDYEMAEWGYISFAELQSINVHGIEIDCETDWTPKKASDIDLIKHCMTL